MKNNDGKIAEPELLSMLYEIRDCFAHINVYWHTDERVIDDCTDKGIRLSHNLEELLLRSQSKFDLIPEHDVVEDDDGWHFVADGDYPGENETVLFYTIGGQTFEGFMNLYGKPYVKDGKIGFEKHEKGWSWYRYRFRDYLPGDCIIAWRYKPVPEGWEDGKEKPAVHQVQR